MVATYPGSIQSTGHNHKTTAKTKEAKKNVLFTEAYTDLLKYPLLVLGTKPVGSALGAGYTAVCADLPPCDPCNRFVHKAGKTFLSSNSSFMTVSPPARVLLLILVNVLSL